MPTYKARVHFNFNRAKRDHRGLWVVHRLPKRKVDWYANAILLEGPIHFHHGSAKQIDPIRRGGPKAVVAWIEGRVTLTQAPADSAQRAAAAQYPTQESPFLRLPPWKRAQYAQQAQWVEVHYNPRTLSHFHTQGGKRIDHALAVWFANSTSTLTWDRKHSTGVRNFCYARIA